MVLRSSIAAFAVPIACLLISASISAAPHPDYQQRAGIGSMGKELVKRQYTNDTFAKGQDQNNPDVSTLSTILADAAISTINPETADVSTATIADSPVESTPVTTPLPADSAAPSSQPPPTAPVAATSPIAVEASSSEPAATPSAPSPSSQSPSSPQSPAKRQYGPDTGEGSSASAPPGTQSDPDENSSASAPPPQDEPDVGPFPASDQSGTDQVKR